MLHPCAGDNVSGVVPLIGNEIKRSSQVTIRTPALTVVCWSSGSPVPMWDKERDTEDRVMLHPCAGDSVSGVGP